MSLESTADLWQTIGNYPFQRQPSLPYWVKITTKGPNCIYYFGPFDSYAEAATMKNGYVEDLQAEKPDDITVTIQACLPTKLTIVEENTI